MAKFLSPDVLELPMYQEDVSYYLAALLTITHWIQNVRHLPAEEEVPKSYLLGPYLHQDSALPLRQTVV
jgi:hypothetical protein